MRALLVLVTLAVWVLAIAYWSVLPESIPMHFAHNGVPDRYADKTVLSWFWMPALGTVFAAALGLIAPGWLRGMAHANSQLLNMPDSVRFRALPAEARVRVMDATMTPMMWLAIILQLLFGWIVFASAQVALEHWQTLPLAPTLSAVALVIACAVSLVFVSNRAVKDEVAAAATDAN